MFKVVMDSSDVKNKNHLCLEPFDGNQDLIKFTIYPDEGCEHTNQAVVSKAHLLKALDFLLEAK